MIRVSSSFLILTGILTTILGCSSPSSPATSSQSSASSSFGAQWARTLVSGTSGAWFNGVIVDSSGNVYAVGSVQGTDTYAFGNSVTATGLSSGTGNNTLIVKYDSSGIAKWAKCQTSGQYVWFTGVTADSAGNVYAVGVTNSGTCGFGNSVTTTLSTGTGPLIVKYNSAGVAQWARTLNSAASTTSAMFEGVAIDGSGNLYAVGEAIGNGTYDFGNSITATGTATGTNGNTLVVKYDNSGVAQWAQTLTSGTAGAWLYSVAVDNSGNVYAAGRSSGNEVYGFGNSVTATGTAAGTYSNSLIVKYNTSGVAQWARTLTSGTGGAVFGGVALDNSGYLYAVGSTGGAGMYGFGNSVTVTGTATGDNALIVKYNTSGVPQWARTLASGATGAYFNVATIDGSGNVYVVGASVGNGIYGYGNSVTAAGTATGTNENTLVLKYDSSGNAQLALTLTSGTGGAWFNGVGIDGSGNLYAVGASRGSDNYGFGNSVTAVGTAAGTNDNTLIVKYR